MTLVITTKDGVTIISLDPRFDANSAPEIETEIKKALAPGPQKVIFDFSQTGYIASAGLRVLLSTSRMVLKGGGAVVLCSLSPQVRQVFDIAGFLKIFTVAGSRDEALTLLKK